MSYQEDGINIEKTKAEKQAATNKTILTTAKGGGITFIGGVIGNIGALVFGVIATNLLGAALFGMYSYAITITNFASAFTNMGLQGGVFRFLPMARLEKNEAKMWGVIQVGVFIPTFLGFLTSLLVFAFAPFIATRVFDAPDFTLVVRIVSFVIPIKIMMEMLATVTRSFKQMQYQVYAQILLFYALKISLTVLLVAIGLNMVGVLVAHIVAITGAALLLLYFVHTLFPINRPIKSAKRETRKILKFSIPLYFSLLLSNPGFRGMIEQGFLGAFGMMVGLGIYSAALRLSSIGNIFFTSLKKISMPIISELYKQRELDQLKHMYQTVTKWSMAFNLPIFLTILLFAEPLLSIFGDEFPAAALGLNILTLGALANASTGTCGSIISMTGHSKLSLVNSIIFLLATLAFDILLIPRYEVVGAATASAISVTTVNLLKTYQVYKLLKMWPYNRSFLKPIVAGVISFGAAYGVYQLLPTLPAIWQMIIVLPILWGGYIGITILLKLSAEDKLVLEKVTARFSLKRLKKLIKPKA